jgi:hypothetical protein
VDFLAVDNDGHFLRLTHSEPLLGATGRKGEHQFSKRRTVS